MALGRKKGTGNDGIAPRRPSAGILRRERRVLLKGREEALRDQRARDFQEKIAEKENAGAQTDSTVVASEIARHLKRRSPDVHAIQKRDYVE